MEVAWKYHENGMKETWKYYGKLQKKGGNSAEAENLWN